MGEREKKEERRELRKTDTEKEGGKRVERSSYLRNKEKLNFSYLSYHLKIAEQNSKSTIKEKEGNK